MILLLVPRRERESIILNFFLQKTYCHIYLGAVYVEVWAWGCCKMQHFRHCKIVPHPVPDFMFKLKFISIVTLLNILQFIFLGYFDFFRLKCANYVVYDSLDNCIISSPQITLPKPEMRTFILKWMKKRIFIKEFRR